jgi:FkbM family methyltransferase
MGGLIKRVVARLPAQTRHYLKQAQCAWQIRSGNFTSSEPEFKELEGWIGEGDWVIDVGANVGRYTLRMASLVGDTGRVFAFEPVIETAALLAANVARLCARNVTVFNAAASDRAAVVELEIPMMETGLPNYYRASVSGPAADGESSQVHAFSLRIDDLALSRRVSFVKIDAEGHELAVLEGMKALLARDLPVLLVEGSCEKVERLLVALDYRFEQRRGSANRIYFT